MCSNYFVTIGTDNHIVLWDARSTGLTGSKIEKILEACSISVNKNTIVGDTSAVSPGGVRLGTPAVTTRSMSEVDMLTISKYIDRIVKLAQEIQDSVGGSKKLLDFVNKMESDQFNSRIENIKLDIENFASNFPFDGINPSEYAN